MTMIRLTAAQALVRYLVSQYGELDGAEVPLFAGVWAIFGHGNVAALGEALHAHRDVLPTFRAHNEQAMGHAAIAFAKASRRRRMMACTSSIGPGATNMVTAAAVAYVNRLPVLFLPGDVFASRRPDPALQQTETWSDGTASANDCFRPVSRYFDRITRPEQLLTALPRAMQVLTDPAECGPVTLALCQDTQAEAIEWPEQFFTRRLWRPRRPPPDAAALAEVTHVLTAARAPMIVAGGGVLYAEAAAVLSDFATRYGIPVCETQAGKGSLSAAHPQNLGAIGVTGTAAANNAAAEADVVLGIGTRLQDFTTGSHSLFHGKLIGLNVQPFDAGKQDAMPLVADAREGLNALANALGDWRAPTAWTERTTGWRTAWDNTANSITAADNREIPTDAQVIGAVQRAVRQGTVVVCAAGGLPGELHKLWRGEGPGTYHLEYGYSCMGYEIAGGLGVKLADPSRDVVVMVGDGSYLMMNSEIATSVAMDLKLTIVLLDNGGFGCINRLQQASGSAEFNNLVPHGVDLRAHAVSLGALAEHVASLAELETAVRRAQSASRTTVIVVTTDPAISTEAGGHWWDVAIPEESTRPEVQTARAAYEAAVQARDGRR
jgi:3D-(3,5/4)-trihydroxycyclohexane-1,2-dione acylhydrolase (decyclizing)